MKKLSAFTLIELMITIAVFAILATLAVPSFSSFILSNSMTTNTNKLLGSLHLARSEAITRGSRISVCASSDAMTAATPSCSGTGKWEEGWVVWNDTDNSNSISGGETIIKVADGASGGSVTMRGTVNVIDIASFISTGFPQNTTGLNYSGTLRICDSRGLTSAGVTNARAIRILASGRIRSTNDAGIIGSCP